MNECMYVCINERMNDHMYVWRNEWSNEWVMNERTNERMNEWMNEGISVCINERMNDHMYVWMNEWRNEVKNEVMNEWMNDVWVVCVYVSSGPTVWSSVWRRRRWLCVSAWSSAWDGNQRWQHDLHFEALLQDLVSSAVILIIISVISVIVGHTYLLTQRVFI